MLEFIGFIGFIAIIVSLFTWKREGETEKNYEKRLEARIINVFCGIVIIVMVFILIIILRL